MGEEQFRERIAHYETMLKEHHKEYGYIANLRLAVLLICIYMTYLLVTKQEAVILVGTVVGYGVFVYLIKKHQNKRELIDQCEQMRAVNEKYLKRLTDEWKVFQDTGEELLDYNHPYAYDLDILGPSSLFQKINTTHTWHGRMSLKNTLLGEKYSSQPVEERQKAIQELIHDLDFCQSIEGIIQGEHTKDATRLISYAKEKRHFFKRSYGERLVYIIPWLVLIHLVIGYIFQNTQMWGLAAILMIGNYLYQFLYIGKISEAKGMLTAILYDLTTYKQILEVLHEKKFQSKYLQELISKLNNDTSDAREGMKQLEKLSNKSHIAYQPIVAIPLNAIWLWDLKVILELEKWQSIYGQYLEEWLVTIGEIENLVSLSVLGHIEEVHFPLMEDSGKYVQANQLGHPLISRDMRVYNDVDLDNQIFVITGSNMSGKTTFLRTIGINLVLAYAGAPVIAKEMYCSQMEIYTSMRIRDDLSTGTSTFYAELMRIKQITDASKREQQILFLIDEIFRGTNSVDRIIGAKSVVKSVSKEGAIGAITTHDLELCQLSDEKKVINYHFTESYTEESIKFDYKLKKGPSTTTNAKYLMKIVGIEVIE